MGGWVFGRRPKIGHVKGRFAPQARKIGVLKVFSQIFQKIAIKRWVDVLPIWRRRRLKKKQCLVSARIIVLRPHRVQWRQCLSSRTDWHQRLHHSTRFGAGADHCASHPRVRHLAGRATASQLDRATGRPPCDRHRFQAARQFARLHLPISRVLELMNQCRLHPAAPQAGRQTSIG